MSSLQARLLLAGGMIILLGAVGFGAYRLGMETAPPRAAVTATDLPAPAVDAEKPVPWGRSCEAGADGKQACAIVQHVVVTDKVNNTSLRALTAAAGYLPGDPKLRLALTVPLGINLRAGIGFQIDEAEPSTLPIEACLADGCHLLMTIDDGGRERLVQSHEIRISYQLANGQKIVLPLSLQGFGDGLARLAP